MKNEDNETKIKVANALRELEDARAMQPLIEALGDEDERVRHAVINDEDFGVRHSAALALGRTGDYRAVAHLNRLLEDDSLQVRFSAEIALRKIIEKTGKGGDTSCSCRNC